MKKIFSIVLLFLFIISCKAQNFPLYNPSDDFNTNGAYYKDLDNDLGKLIGTWLFENVNSDERIQIILDIKHNDFVSIPERGTSYYEDVLYGEYRYIDSEGNEIVNSLSDINNFSNDVSRHLVYGNSIKKSTQFVNCNSCDPNDRIVEVFIEDPQRDYFYYNLQITHVPADAFTPEKIKIVISRVDMAFPATGQPNDNRLPMRQEYVLIKQ